MFIKEYDVHGGITLKDIDDIRRKVKIGDRIRINTVKSCSIEQMNRKIYGTVRKGKVVAKYPHFAIVEHPNGVRESVLWVDIIRKRRNPDEE